VLAPEPFFFGSSEAPLLGWLHAASNTQEANIGVIICNPFGYEEVCAHRSIIEIAKAASENGFPALRFDYLGCGDSAGDAFVPLQLDRWVDSVHAAVDALKQASCVGKVYLLGIRLGAMLASLAAAGRTDVAGLIAIAPVVQGRKYVRELTVLGNSGFPGARLGQEMDGLLEAAGFVLTAETTDAISKVDLCAIEKTPVKKLLILERDDISVAPAWATAMEHLGAEVHRETWPGYREMSVDPIYSRAGSANVNRVIQAMLDWADESGDKKRGSKEHAIDLGKLSRSAGMGAGVVETAVTIETGTSSLFGILTAPVSSTISRRQVGPVGLVLINAGAVHHIGQNRMWVEFSRKWALHGVTTLRFDLSGIGESPARTGASENEVYSANAQQDISQAIAFLRQHIGDGECHLMGLCSGAYHAFKSSASQRVTSVLVINPLTFYWKDGMSLDVGIKSHQVIGASSNYLRRIFSGEPWRKLLSGKMDVGYVFQVVIRRLWALIQPSVAGLARMVRLPLEEDLGGELAAIARQGVQQRFVFATGDPGSELLRQMGGRMLGKLVSRELVSIDNIPNADHTFTTFEARVRLVKVLETRLFGVSVGEKFEIRNEVIT
jgi:pimeloyl-ACP methyl ester carboxylesterase